MDLRWPKSKAELEQIQRERKRVAVERAMQAPFFKHRLGNIHLEKLDDEWRRIPILTKEELRQIPPGRFHDEFCIQPRTKVVEYWRSGGATGLPDEIRRNEEVRKAYLGEEAPA